MVKKAMMIRAQDHDVDGGGGSTLALRDQVCPLNVSVETAKLARLGALQKMPISFSVCISRATHATGMLFAMAIIALVTAELAVGAAIARALALATFFATAFALRKFWVNTSPQTLTLQAAKAPVWVSHRWREFPAAVLARLRGCKIAVPLANVKPMAFLIAEQLSFGRFRRDVHSATEQTRPLYGRKYFLGPTSVAVNVKRVSATNGLTAAATTLWQIERYPHGRILHVQAGDAQCPA